MEIGPGGQATVRGGASNGAKYFWYAENDAGMQWAGPFVTNLPIRAFDWCWRTSSTDSSPKGLRMLLVPVTQREPLARAAGLTAPDMCRGEPYRLAAQGRRE